MTTLLRVRLIYQTMYLMECADALQFVEAHFRMSDEASSFGNQIGPCGFSELAGHVGEGGDCNCVVLRGIAVSIHQSC
jgi:hypothetical protein